MIVGIPKETHPGERRVAMTPTGAAPLVKAGLDVRVESGAGADSGFPDAEYQAKGVKVVVSRAELFQTADVLLQVRTPGANPTNGKADLAAYRRGQVVLGFADPLSNLDAVKAMASAGVTLFAIELLPRITRAQAMDALSSQANLAGYRAVLLAASQLPKILPMLTTAAGTLQPGRVFVLGAGVAGLQAIATARRLGAVVHAYDVRPAVKEQVQSLGARFVELPLETADAETKGGYAKELATEQVRRQQELLAKTVAESDIVITTAAVPGKKSPILVTADAVKGMKPGSVVIDLAAERGGNCELTEADRTVVKHGVTILGPTNLVAEVPQAASQMYTTNLVKLLQHLLTKEGKLTFDLTDEITAGSLVCQSGEVVNALLRPLLGLPPIAAAVAAPAAPAAVPVAAPTSPPQ